MYLSLVFFISFLIVILFPILGKLKLNLKIFLSFSIGIASSGIIYYFLASKGFINSFVWKVYELFKNYFLHIENDEIVFIKSLQIMCFFLIFIVLYSIITILLSGLIVEKSFGALNKKNMIYIMGIIFLKSINILICTFSVLIMCVVFNQFWNFDYGILERFFNLIYKMVYQL